MFIRFPQRAHSVIMQHLSFVLNGHTSLYQNEASPTGPSLLMTSALFSPIPGLPTCRCPNGFTGSRCNKQLCTDYCHNNGNCTVTQGNQPNCRCPVGFMGDRCQYRKYLSAHVLATRDQRSGRSARKTLHNNRPEQFRW